MTQAFASFHHVGVVVRDLEASIGWYARHLGFERGSEYGFPGARVAFVGRGDLILELMQVEGAEAMPAEREQPATNLRIGGINHFAIAVDELDRTVEELAATGVEVASPPRDVPDGSGARYAFVRDNERMLVELFQRPGTVA
jgi:catechol 2,3-dioxygenase-like lactoylglutathione lyase family enzyme